MALAGSVGALAALVPVLGMLAVLALSVAAPAVALAAMAVVDATLRRVLAATAEAEADEQARAVPATRRAA